MEGATLTFRFVEEGGGATGPTANPQAVEGQVDQSVSATQQAITNAGGVGSFVTRNNPTPTPSASTFNVPAAAPLSTPPLPTVTTSNNPDLQMVEQLRRADPNATPAEIAKALEGLGYTAKQAQSLAGQAIAPSAPPLSTPPSAVPTTPTATTQPPPVPTIQLPPVPPPVAGTVPPPVVQPPPIQGEPTPPPVQGQPTPQATPNTLPSNAAQGVANTVNSIAHFAQAGGPLGSALAGTATAVTNLPGVASSIAAAAPGLAYAAPYVALAGAALAVPVAAAATINNEFERARSQLQGLDPRVATAEAEANVRQILANFRTSARLGDEVAEGIEIRSRRSAALQGIRDVISEVPMQRLNDAANGFTKTVELLNSAIQNNSVVQRLTQGASNLAYSGLLSGTGLIGIGAGAFELLNKFLPKAEEIKNNNPLTYWQNRPMPKLPPPFSEAGEASKPKINPNSFAPGLGIDF